MINTIILPKTNYVPRIQNAEPLVDPKKFKFGEENSYKVVEIIDEGILKLDTGLIVKFLGVKVIKREETLKYLKEYVLGKEVILKFDFPNLEQDSIKAYVYLKNKIFINAYLIKSGLAIPDLLVQHRYKEKFIEIWKEIEDAKGMDIKYGNK